MKSCRRLPMPSCFYLTVQIFGWYLGVVVNSELSTFLKSEDLLGGLFKTQEDSKKGFSFIFKFVPDAPGGCFAFYQISWHLSKLFDFL